MCVQCFVAEPYIIFIMFSIYRRLGNFYVRNNSLKFFSGVTFLQFIRSAKFFQQLRDTIWTSA